jgi:hypothetical protein
VPWITATVLGAVTFATTRAIEFQNRKEEINRERTEISFVTRLEEQRNTLSQEKGIASFVR